MPVPDGVPSFKSKCPSKHLSLGCSEYILGGGGGGGSTESFAVTELHIPVSSSRVLV